jgi:hypothetical protein
MNSSRKQARTPIEVMRDMKEKGVTSSRKQVRRATSSKPLSSNLLYRKSSNTPTIPVTKNFRCSNNPISRTIPFIKYKQTFIKDYYESKKTYKLEFHDHPDKEYISIGLIENYNLIYEQFPEAISLFGDKIIVKHESIVIYREDVRGVRYLESKLVTSVEEYLTVHSVTSYYDYQLNKEINYNECVNIEPVNLKNPLIYNILPSDNSPKLKHSEGKLEVDDANMDYAIIINCENEWRRRKNTYIKYRGVPTCHCLRSTRVCKVCLLVAPVS